MSKNWETEVMEDVFIAAGIFALGFRLKMEFH